MEKISQNMIEQKESLPVVVETISTDDLVNLIYKGENLPQDSRFLSTEQGGVFEYFDLRHIQDNKNDKFYPVVSVGEKIVGLSELLKDPFVKNNLWIQFLSVDPKEQGNGYASKIAKEIFEFAKKNGYSLETSHYTEEGLKKMRSVFDKLSEEYSTVPFINKGKL